jgi:hypothetical protein
MGEVVTVHVYPPIPIRSFDWMAYEAAWDGDPETAHGYAIAYGATEAEAVAEVRAIMTFREEEAREEILNNGQFGVGA